MGGSERSQACTAVIGLGYVGLQLVVGAAEAGLTAVGLDRNSEVVAGLNAGRSHVNDLSDAHIEVLLARGFRATTDPSVLANATVAVICVPTPLTVEGGPDLTDVMSAAEDVAAGLTAGQLVVLESTTYPGTTDEVVRPILERSGLRAGSDFSLAFSPERIDPGNSTFGLRNTPKVVGGHTPACAAAAAAFYRQVVDEVVIASGTREAEMTKLLENTYRHVNIALVNEMAQFCHELGIDLWEAIRCAATKPFGFEAFQPGPGVGGHCIPIDPNFLSHRVRTHLGHPFRFIELAQEINALMPSYVVRRAQGLLNDVGKPMRSSRVLLLGITYKADINDQRETPALALALGLLGLGADVRYHDPYVPRWQVNGTSLYSERDPVTAAKDADLVVLVQAHTSYDLEAVAATNTPVLDTRGRMSGSAVQRL